GGRGVQIFGQWQFAGAGDRKKGGELCFHILAVGGYQVVHPQSVQRLGKIGAGWGRQAERQVIGGGVGSQDAAVCIHNIATRSRDRHTVGGLAGLGYLVSVVIRLGKL